MNATTSTENMQLVDIEKQPTHHIVTQQGGAISATSPAGMMIAMMERGASLEQIEKMMDLQERWKRLEAEKAYNAAFASFKAEAVRIVKTCQVKDGPLKGKAYAELFSVVDAITPALSRNGLGASWRITRDDRDWIEVTCTLKHIDGYSECVSMGGPPDSGGAKNAIQARASTVSYLERYTLKAICGVAEGGDDDNGGADARPENDASSAGDGDLLSAGNAAAKTGMKALTAWWGGLSAKQRGELSKSFGFMRKVALAADAGGGNA